MGLDGMFDLLYFVFPCYLNILGAVGVQRPSTAHPSSM